jgi:hypothetical protein
MYVYMYRLFNLNDYNMYDSLLPSSAIWGSQRLTAGHIIPH